MTIPIWILNLSTAIFNGWGNALLFVGSATYVNACANDKNKGLYNAILWCGNQGCLITGNLIAAYVIPIISEAAYFMICIGLLVVACFWFMLLKIPDPQPESLEESLVLRVRAGSENNDVKVEAVDALESDPKKDLRQNLVTPEDALKKSNASRSVNED